MNWSRVSGAEISSTTRGTRYVTNKALSLWERVASDKISGPKARGSEVRNILYFLPFIELAGNEELENERYAIMEAGADLIGLYDSIIAECSQPVRRGT